MAAPRKAGTTAAICVLAFLVPGCFSPAPAKLDAPALEGAPLTTWQFAQGSPDGHRFSADPAVTLATLPALGQAWTAPTQGAVTGTPTVADGHVFVATWKGLVYSMFVGNGTVAWSRDLGSQIDGSVTLAGALALVGDSAGRLHALDAATGREVWVRLLDDHLHTHLYATPLVVPARGTRAAFVVQAVGSDQESVRIHGDAPVDFRGQVAALGLANGTVLWRTFLVPPGQTGAPVWGTPVFDAGTDRIVFGTGNAYTDPAGEMTDAIVALAAEDGKVAWHVQGLAGDVFTQRDPDNPDADFGSTPVLFPSGNRTLAGIGQKSSVFWAVDVATGAVAWKSGQVRSGEGIIGDAALAGDTLVVPYVTLSQVAGLAAQDGAVRWRQPLAGLGFADPVAVEGAVIVADASGAMRGFEAATGKEVWNMSLGEEGAVFGGLSVAEGTLFVPLVRDGFIGDVGGLMAVKPQAAGGGLQVAGETSNAAGVVMRGFQFEPREIHVAVGGSLPWHNQDPVLHTVTATDGSFDVTVPAGETVQVHFPVKGTFAYYCKPHATPGDQGSWQGMTGTVIVD